MKKTKVCTGCNENKSFDDYHKAKNGRYGLKAKCKSCRKENKKKWLEENPNYNKEYWDRVKGRRNKNRREKYKNNKKYREKVKQRKYEYVSDRLQNDPEFRLMRNCRRRVLHVLSRDLKKEKTIELLGCEREELVRWLERQFDDSMTWENYGEVWHIDHEIPCAKFDLTDPHQRGVCFHYSNLQPMLKENNFRKNDQIQVNYEENNSKSVRDIGYYINYGFCNS